MGQVNSLTFRIEQKALKSYKQGAAKRGIPWKLSDSQAIRLMTSCCHYCGCRPGKNGARGPGHETLNRMNGIDRVNNSGGYTPQNTVPCCVRCNMMKGRLSETDFLDHICKIIKHYYEQKSQTDERFVRGDPEIEQ